jgi:hypothetical protein
MIKKILILAILGGLGYIGYLVWNNLTPKEQAVVAGKAGEVVDGAKDLAGKAADKLTGVAKEEIKKIEQDDKQAGDLAEPKPAEDPAPPKAATGSD